MLHPEKGNFPCHESSLLAHGFSWHAGAAPGCQALAPFISFFCIYCKSEPEKSLNGHADGICLGRGEEVEGDSFAKHAHFFLT